MERILEDINEETRRHHRKLELESRTKQDITVRHLYEWTFVFVLGIGIGIAAAPIIRSLDLW